MPAHKLVRVKAEYVIEAHKRGLIVSRVCNTALIDAIERIDRAQRPAEIINLKELLEGTKPKEVIPETINKILTTT